MSLTNIFPTPIYVTNVSNLDNILNEFDQIKDQVIFNRSNKERGYANSLTDHTKSVVIDFNMHYLLNEIDKCLYEYCKLLGIQLRPFMIKSWFTKTEPTEYLQIHHHNDVDITGTFYYQAEENCGDLFFESSTGPAPHSPCFAHLHNRHYITPEVGKLVLFPGWLRHGVLKNESDTTRLGVSFNISFQR